MEIESDIEKLIYDIFRMSTSILALIEYAIEVLGILCCCLLKIKISVEFKLKKLWRMNNDKYIVRTQEEI